MISNILRFYLEHNLRILFLLKIASFLFFVLSIINLAVYFNYTEKIKEFIFKDRLKKEHEKDFLKEKARRQKEKRKKEYEERIKNMKLKERYKDVRVAGQRQTTTLAYNPFTHKEEAIPKSFKALGFTEAFPKDEKELKKRYRELAKKHHPDAPNGNTDKFKELQKNYTETQNLLKKYKKEVAR